MSYQTGDVIEQCAFGGVLRFVRVEGREADVKNGRPGFFGKLCDKQGQEVGGDDPIGNGVWGYDSQVVRVMLRALA